MNITNLFPGSYASNCYLLEDNGQAVIIDPSASASTILRRVQEDGCTPSAVLLTHGHFDHITSIDTLRKHTPIDIHIHEEDAPMLTDGAKNGVLFFFGRDKVYKPAEKMLHHGDIIPVGNATLEVIHTPGHSPGSVCFLCQEEGILFTGDTLFADNIGRYDLWGGDLSVLKSSLELLRTLDGDLTILSGHGSNNKLSSALQIAFSLFH